MNKKIISFYNKAGLCACLFLCFAFAEASANKATAYAEAASAGKATAFAEAATADKAPLLAEAESRTVSAEASAKAEWAFDAATQKAYDLVLNLQVDEARQLIGDANTPQQHYVLALAEALELLITEDGEKYTEYEERFELRNDRKLKLGSADELLLQAEIHLQWAFVYLKYGHEFDAALNLREAYLTTQEIKQRFPAYQAIKKTSGLLEVLIGSVPEKYNWVLSLLSIEGSVDTGLAELESFANTTHPLKLEAHMLYALIQGFVLQKPDVALAQYKTVLASHPSNRLVLFLGTALYMKNSQSEEALTMLNKLEAQPPAMPIYYTEYLKGEIYLHKAEYLNSITAYRAFINQYKGQHYIKDAYYKIGLCYWLNGNANDAQAAFKDARNLGKEATEADKYAARSLAETELPQPKLTKARYFTDGGYYDQARIILFSIPLSELPTLRDKVELAYRKARLDHKTNNLAGAKHFYEETIKLSGNESWYFAPNACLQLGYIARDEGDKTAAAQYFNRALSYKKHEYKNSIDSKAKSALAQLRRK